MSVALLNLPLSLYSIPAAWVLAALPHVIKFQMINKAHDQGYNNFQPRENSALLASNDTVDVQEKQRIARAEAAHQNGLESFPLWSIAVLAANYAGLSQRAMNLTALLYLTSRALYNYIYINQSKEWHGTLRSIVWAVGVGASLVLATRAANLTLASQN